jgi:hypothetical protein
MKYYKFYDISFEDEDGWYYCEADEQYVIQRQVKVFGEKMYWATRYSEKDGTYDFTDQTQIDPIDLEGQYGGIEISAEEFEGIWLKSL